MDALEDVQLNAQAKEAEIRSRSGLFGSARDNLLKNMGTAVHYLDSLLEQYEAGNRHTMSDTEPIYLSDELTDFIKPRHESQADQQYFLPAERARDTLTHLIESLNATEARR